jgi:hypothetical protein
LIFFLHLRRGAENLIISRAIINEGGGLEKDPQKKEKGVYVPVRLGCIGVGVVTQPGFEGIPPPAEADTDLGRKKEMSPLLLEVHGSIGGPDPQISE